MLIAVAHKWAPDPADAVVAADGAVDFSRAHPGLGAYDAVAIAVARGLADAVGAELVGLSAGPEATLAPQARKAVLARGLDRLLLAAAPGDAGASVTAAALVGLVRHAGEVDVVVAGEASVDAGAGLVPALLAGRLGWLCLLEVTAVRPGPAAGELVVARRTASGIEELTVATPVVLGCAPDAAEPRTPGMRDLLAAGRKPAEVVPVEPVADAAGAVAVTGRRRSPVPDRTRQVLAGEPDAAASALVAELRRRGALAGAGS